MKIQIFNKEAEILKNNEDLNYLMGFIIGDGNLSSKYLVRAVEENKEFIQEIFARKFSKVFKRMPKIYFDSYNNSFVAYVHSKKIWTIFKHLGIPSGNKSRIVRVPKTVKEDSKLRCSLLCGLFDAEGSVIEMKDSHHKNGYLRIQMKVHNHGLAKDVFEVLSLEGIKSNLYEYNDFSMIHINGKKQASIFVEKIGFEHPIKAKKLRALL